MARKKKKKKRKKRNTLPTQVELFMSAGSEIAVSAFMRSGGGVHEDSKTKRKRTRATKKAAALQEEMEK